MTICADEEPAVTVTLTTNDEPLVLGADCVEEGMGWNQLSLPQWALRYEYAPPSRFLPGQTLLSAVPDAAAVAMTVVARGADLDAVEAQKAILALVVGQWRYTLTIEATPDGGSPTTLGSWDAKPTVPVWGPDVDPAIVGLLVAVGTVLIPVNPAGSP